MQIKSLIKKTLSLQGFLDVLGGLSPLLWILLFNTAWRIETFLGSHISVRKRT